MLQGPVKNVRYNDPPVQYRGERIISIIKKLMDVDHLPGFVDTTLTISVYYSLFLPYPVLDETYKPNTEKEKLQMSILSALLSSPKLIEIKRNTIADSATSTVAAAVFLEALIRSMPNQTQPKRGEGMNKQGESEGEGVKGQKSIEEIVDEALDTIKEQTQQAKEIVSLAAKFLAGTGSMLSFEDSIQDIIRLARQTNVKAVLEALKSIEDIGGYVKRRCVRTVRGELDGYELGSDIERIVPTELALPREFLLVKLAESGLLLYRKVVPETKGPFYVLLDKSGSMMGLKIVWAKAVALALAMKASREHRTFFIRFFDSIPYPSLRIGKSLRGRDVIKLLEYVARVRANGGTDITRAVLAAAEDIAATKSKNPADIVLITDGEDRIAVDVVRRALARARTRLHTVMVHGNNPDLKTVSDTYMTVTKLSREEALSVIKL